MSAQDFAKTIAEALQGVLNPIGFRKRGYNFFAQRDDVVAVVQLQRSRYSTHDQLIATVNLGVFSRTLSRRLGREVAAPSIGDCHWWERLGFLTPERYDRWWEV